MFLIIAGPFEQPIPLSSRTGNELAQRSNVRGGEQEMQKK
jgi:hypothetical protein